VAGQFAGSINLGGSTLVAQTDEDVFVAKFNAGGDHIWSKSFSASGGFGLDAIAVDPSGQPVIFGSFAGSVNFGGGALNAVTAFDVYVAKFTTGGAHLWSKRFGLTGDFSGEAMDVDASGRVALAGNAYGTINFGGGILTPVGGPDVFVAVLNSSGNHVWSKMFGGDASEYANDVAFASNTDLLISVYARGPGEFNFGGPQVEAQPDFFDLFVARLFVANGAHRWTQGFTADGGSLFGYVGATGGDFFLGGTMTGPIDFGGGLLSNTHDEDMFVVRFGDHELTGAAPSLARASLEQNSPNPFNPQTRIDYTLVAPAHAVIEIFDASGAVVARLDEGRKPAGSYAAAWNGRDGKGRAVASGVYFYRLAGMPEVAAKKMVLLK
jgi:hypothetical protein